MGKAFILDGWQSWKLIKSGGADLVPPYQLENHVVYLKKIINEIARAAKFKHYMLQGDLKWVVIICNRHMS